MRRRERTLLAAEIAAAYLRARRALASQPISAALATLRRGAWPFAANGAPLGHGASAGDAAQRLAEASRLGRAVARTLALVPGDTRCLARSLVLSQLLARRNIEATLVIAARTAPRFLAHAWVEHEGQPVLDPGDGSFARLVEL